MTIELFQALSSSKKPSFQKAFGCFSYNYFAAVLDWMLLLHFTNYNKAKDGEEG